MAEGNSYRALASPDWVSALKCVAEGKEGDGEAFVTFLQGMGTLVRLHHAFGASFTADETRKLVDALTGKIIQIYTKTASESNAQTLLKLELFSCPVCYEVVEEPLTVRCGHTYCKKCLTKEVAGNQCRSCSYRLSQMDLRDTKPNVLLMSLTDKLWPKHKETAALRSEGNELFRQERFMEALGKYTEAINLNPFDHLSLCNRAHTFWLLGNYLSSLQDVEKAIKHCPFWFKSYFRKAATLDSLGRYEDAFCTLTLCLYLIKVAKSPDDTPIVLVKNEMVKVFLKMFSSALTAAQLSLRRKGGDPSSPFCPYPEQKKRAVRHPNGSWSEPENASSGEESEGKDWKFKSLKEHSALHHQKGRVPHLASHHDPAATRLHHIFSLAVTEVLTFEKLAPSNERVLDEALVSFVDFECSLCYRLMYQPVTTTCGHTYCRSCLERCLDHSPTCPLCKTKLDSCVAYQRHAITYTLELLISRFYPKEHEDRVNQHLEELADCCTSGRNKELEIPIFVCTMAFPTVPCLLHVFEPRYRLMIRRCMEAGSKKFGMCCYLQDGDHNYGDFGTMLEIRNIQYFPDGRSVVNTVGGRRFRVLKKTVKDGYNVATIEYLEDKPIEEAERVRLRETHETVFKDANEWLQSIDSVIRDRIITHFGNMPSPEEDWMNVAGGPAWTWWLLAILPLDAKAQLAILGMGSLMKRLESLQKVLRFVKTRLN